MGEGGSRWPRACVRSYLSLSLSISCSLALSPVLSLSPFPLEHSSPFALILPALPIPFCHPTFSAPFSLFFHVCFVRYPLRSLLFFLFPPTTHPLLDLFSLPSLRRASCGTFSLSLSLSSSWSSRYLSVLLWLLSTSIPQVSLVLRATFPFPLLDSNYLPHHLSIAMCLCWDLDEAGWKERDPKGGGREGGRRDASREADFR